MFFTGAEQAFFHGCFDEKILYFQSQFDEPNKKLKKVKKRN